MANSAVSQSEVKYFDGDQLRAMVGDISDGKSKDVHEVMIGQHPMDCEIRGVKAGPLGLHSNKNWVTSPSVKQICVDWQSLSQVFENPKTILWPINNFNWGKEGDVLAPNWDFVLFLTVTSNSLISDTGRVVLLCAQHGRRALANA